MGFYSKYLFPRMMNIAMSGETITAYRQEILTEASGRVLEIGFGTGLNLPYYPAHIQELHVIEVNEGMKMLARKNISSAAIRVILHTADAEALPFPDASFDTIVSTWTLCSIAAVTQALQEVHRVLKPSGKFLFVEHGLSPDVPVQKWQHRLTPLQRLLAGGCHLDRDIELLVAQAGFRFMRLRKEYAPGISKTAGYFYIGIAAKELSLSGGLFLLS